VCVSVRTTSANKSLRDENREQGDENREQGDENREQGDEKTIRLEND
jgi:hypothetical protein